jgi:hypothetical protein
MMLHRSPRERRVRDSFVIAINGWLLVTLMAVVGQAAALGRGQQDSAAVTSAEKDSSVASSTVGFPVRIEQLKLPGSRLVSRPLESRTEPIVVRVLDAFAHGDGFRYDLEVTGFTPGKHNLCEGLLRADGSSSADLPAVWVEIATQLPPGQVKPNELQPSAPQVLSLYTGLLIAAGGLWLLGLAAIIFWGREKEHHLSQRRRHMTVADRLRPLLEQAATGQLASVDRAALERVLLAFWRKKLRLETLPPAELIPRLRKHPEAAALMEQLETWLHAPPTEQPIDWQPLLAPYRTMDLAELELP